MPAEIEDDFRRRQKRGLLATILRRFPAVTKIMSPFADVRLLKSGIYVFV